MIIRVQVVFYKIKTQKNIINYNLIEELNFIWVHFWKIWDSYGIILLYMYIAAICPLIFELETLSFLLFIYLLAINYMRL